MKPCALPSDVVRTVLQFLEDLDTPISLGLYLRVKAGDWDGVLEVSPDPRDYLYGARYAKDAAAAAFVKKLNNLPTSHDRRSAAIAKWRAGEDACYRSNERLARYLPEFSNSTDSNEYVSDFLSEVKQLVRTWIGNRPDDLAIGRFGPGATFSDRGGRTTVPDKMSADPVMTRGAIWFLPQWYGTQWGAYHARHSRKVSFVPGNRFTTVPKTAKVDRCIAAEPPINVFFQLALGRQLRSRLRRRTGWDLDRAQDIHRQVACESSHTREFATLDLSNASDTISRVLVKLLLPHYWHDQLDGLRSPKTLIDGKWVMLEKFSSMGNGFTFELETIIFAAIACVTSQRCGYKGQLGVDVFVFGDDIIVKNSVARPLKSCLEFLGFELNVEKSYFGDEPFRESCGGDYFDSKPVRPYYLKELPNGPQDYIALANGISALDCRLALTGLPALRRTWFHVLDQLPKRVRDLRGPQALGDLVIHDEPERWTTKTRHSIRYIRVFRPHRLRVVDFKYFKPDIVLACATYGTGNRRGGVIPRDGVLSYKVGWVAWS